MKIEFIKSPTGTYNLAYNVGGVWDCTDVTFAEKLINQGYAKRVGLEVPATNQEIKRTKKHRN